MEFMKKRISPGRNLTFPLSYVLVWRLLLLKAEFEVDSLWWGIASPAGFFVILAPLRKRGLF
jgi:hypothetical protein